MSVRSRLAVVVLAAVLAGATLGGALPAVAVGGTPAGPFAELEEARDELEEAAERVQAAVGAKGAALEAALMARRRLARHLTRLTQVRAEHAGLLEQYAAARGELGRAAAAAFVRSGLDGSPLGLEGPEVAAGRVLAGAVGDDLQRAVARVDELKVGLDADLVRIGEDIAGGSAVLTAAEAALVAAVAEELQARHAYNAVLETVSAALRGLVGGGRVSPELPGTDLPITALHAYQLAARWARSSGSCAIEWWMIAAIGRHESHHGRYLSAALYTDGTVSPKIIGIPLDGTRSLRVWDTDNGVLDGDTVYDRAVGPMQFIPGTWYGYRRMFDVDANGDGFADPHNIYEATRATASLLCRNAPTLTTAEGLKRGLWSYNPSESYNVRVFASSQEYRSLEVPDLVALLGDERGNPVGDDATPVSGDAGE
jgi:hypothetical protein